MTDESDELPASESGPSDPAGEQTNAFPPPTLPHGGSSPDGPARDRVDTWSAAVGDGPSLIGVSFDRPLRAQEFLLAMGRLREDGALDLQDAVVVTKGNDGKVRVTETVDPTPGRAAFSGAMWTGLIGLLVGGPVGWLAGLGVGAGAGAVTAKVVDLGIPDEWVAWFKAAVLPGTSTVVVLADDVDLVAFEREARRFPGAELLHSTLPPGIVDDLARAFEGRSPR